MFHQSLAAKCYGNFQNQTTNAMGGHLNTPEWCSTLHLLPCRWNYININIAVVEPRPENCQLKRFPLFGAVQSEMKWNIKWNMNGIYWRMVIPVKSR